MPDTKKDRPSEEEMWAGPSGERWLANANLFEDSIGHIGDELIERAGLRQGERVIDVGCGAGGMSLQMAQRVGSGGAVTGVDISQGLVTEATRRAAVVQPAAKVQFVRADAAKTPLPPGEADCLVSRFGIMFFTDPFGAFAHLHTLIKPTGRLAMATWASPKQNLWMMEMRAILARHFELPTPPPRTPGPFAFEETDYQRDILTKAGFKDIDIQPWKTEMRAGGRESDPESAADFLMNALSIAQRALDAPEETRKKVRNELRDRLRDFATPEGVRMPGAVWMTTARA